MRTWSFFRTLLVVCLVTALGALVGSGAIFLGTARPILVGGLGQRARSTAVTLATTLEQDGLTDWLTSSPWDGRRTIAQGELPERMVAELERMEIDPRGLAVLVLDSAAAAARTRLEAELDEILSSADFRKRRAVQNVSLYVEHEGVLFVAADADESLLESAAIQDYGRGVGLKHAVLLSGEAEYTGAYDDPWGTWIAGVAPLHDAKGRVVAVVSVEMPFGFFGFLQQLMGVNLALSLIPSLILALAVAWFASRHLTRPLHRITDAMERVGRGEHDHRIAEGLPVSELARIAGTFNEMAAGVQEKLRLRTVLDQAVSKEVAQALLSGKAGEGEVREATVMFTDIRGFTAMSEELPAREVLRLLNDYISLMAPIVARHGGIIDKFLGDGLLMVFGAPVPLSDDSLAAVRAGLEMTSALTAFNQRLESEGRRRVEIGVGINTGPVVAGTVGSAERASYTVLGSAVNLASRLCAQAKPMQIVISPNTYVRVKTRVDAFELPPLTLKGVTLPLTAFEVRGLKETA